MPVIQGPFGPTLPFVHGVIRAHRPTDRARGPYKIETAGLLLVDSGSALSCVRSLVAEELGLIPRSTTDVTTINGDRESDVYRIDIDLSVAGVAYPINLARAVNAIEDRSNWPPTLAGQVIGIIGVDVLAKLEVLLDGPGGTFKVSV